MNRRKNFILIAEIASRQVKVVMEGPDEQKLNANQIQDIDATFSRKIDQLRKKFSSDMYDIMYARALDRDDLRQGYPEFSGWEQVEVETVQ